MDDAWDVIVVGGGPAGCTAAISAAREGAKTLLVEATGCLGGMGTVGLVPCWCPFSDKEQIIYKGLAEQIFEQAKKNVYNVSKEDIDWVPIDAETLKRIYDDMVLSSGATVMFHTMLSGVETDEQGNVQIIYISNKSGLSCLKAKVFVDCTGDADLASWAGAEFQKGDQNGEMQPATHCFVLSNVNEEEYVKGPLLHSHNIESPIFEIVSSGRFPHIKDVHLCNSLVGPSTVGFNAGHLWNVDNTDPENISKALVEGRKIAETFRLALAEYHPKAFKDSFLVATGSLIGIRETRRITGDYILTVEDYMDRRSFEDEICRNSYFIDIHTAVDEIESTNVSELNIEGRFPHYGKGESHGVPYRCLTPKGLNNVLVAGRSISCDRPVQGSVRIMPCCLAMGEAAGIAAVLTSKSQTINVHCIDVKELRAKLIANGAYIKETD